MSARLAEPTRIRPAVLVALLVVVAAVVVTLAVATTAGPGARVGLWGLRTQPRLLTCGFWRCQAAGWYSLMSPRRILRRLDRLEGDGLVAVGVV